MAEIKVEHVAKTFGSFTAVKGVDFTVDQGSFFVILGPSGCGKTTTLRMMAGLELPTSGRILLDGEDVTALPASGARHCLCVPAVCALPAYECAPEHRLSIEMPELPARRD